MATKKPDPVPRNPPMDDPKAYEYGFDRLVELGFAVGIAVGSRATRMRWYRTDEMWECVAILLPPQAFTYLGSCALLWSAEVGKKGGNPWAWADEVNV